MSSHVECPTCKAPAIRTERVGAFEITDVYNFTGVRLAPLKEMADRWFDAAKTYEGLSGHSFLFDCATELNAALSPTSAGDSEVAPEVKKLRFDCVDSEKEHCIRCGSWYLDTGWECNDCGYDNMPHYAKPADGQKACVQPNTKPASLPISVTPVADQALLCVKVGPLLTYTSLDEAIALRAQLDAEIARLSERFL